MLIFPTPKMKPIQGMMGMGGGATGYLKGASIPEGPGILRYIDRSTDGTYNNNTTKPGTLTSSNWSQGWSHSGSNADGIVINISGTGTYDLYSLSIGSSGSGSSDTFNHTLYLRVETGNTTGSGNLLLNTNSTYTLGYTSATWHELILPTAVTLDRGTSYYIGYAVASGDSFPGTNQMNSAYKIGSSANTSMSVTTVSGQSATVTISDPSYGAADPWDASNATDSGRGQIPIIGIKI